MKSGPTLIALGIAQMASGLGALIGHLGLLTHIIRLLGAAFTRFQYAVASRRRVTGVTAVAYGIAVIADSVAAMVDSSPGERTGAPLVWLALAIGATVMWALARRREAPSSRAEAS